MGLSVMLAAGALVVFVLVAALVVLLLFGTRK
jgi:hypothetical protein